MLVCVFGLLLAGCNWFEQIEEPVAGEKQYVLTPEGVQKMDAMIAAGDAAAMTTQSVGFWWPPAALAGGVLAGIFGALRKIKPELETAQNRAALGAASGRAMVLAIEAFKDQYPDEYDKHLRKELENSIEYGTAVENFIRELRGLNPRS